MKCIVIISRFAIGIFRAASGNGFISGLGSQTLNRIVFDGHGGAKTAERWDAGKRIRDVEQAPDGSLWMLEDANPGALIHVTPKVISSR